MSLSICTFDPCGIPVISCILLQCVGKYLTILIPACRSISTAVCSNAMQGSPMAPDKSRVLMGVTVDENVAVLDSVVYIIGMHQTFWCDVTVGWKYCLASTVSGRPPTVYHKICIFESACSKEHCLLESTIVIQSPYFLGLIRDQWQLQKPSGKVNIIFDFIGRVGKMGNFKNVRFKQALWYRSIELPDIPLMPMAESALLLWN